MLVYIIVAVLAVWLLAISIVTFKQFGFLRGLVKDSSEKDLVKVLKRILESEQVNEKNIDQIKRELVLFHSEGLNHIQKIGVVRFNPFRETGGDHSFSLAMLDGKDNGFIITGLHTRERTRLYLKWLKDGKSETELSNEEKKAFVAAQKS
jgi:hypothetical protein